MRVAVLRGVGVLALEFLPMPVGFMNRRFALVTSCVLGTIMAAGCQRTATTSLAPDAASAVASGAAAPISERDQQRQKEFAEAIEGLRFENGVITVDRRLPGTAVDAWAHHAEGETLRASNRRTEAIKSYAHAVRTSPDLPEFYLGLGHAFITKGKTDYAAAAYRTAANLDVGGVDALAELALTMAREGRRDEAIETMQSVLLVDPDHGFAHERLAIWQYYAGDDSAAWQHVRHARRIGHDVPPQFIALLERRSPQPE